jgi:TonB-linked SusC/RagA family outer membrane protein
MIKKSMFMITLNKKRWKGKDVFSEQCRKTLLAMLCAFMCLSGAYAQRVVTGKVTGDKGETLSGVFILIKGTNGGTSTDIDGQYSLNVSAQDVLVFSYLGYQKQEILVNNQNKIDVILLEDVKGLNEVVVTALGIRREKKALGYAMQEVKGDGLADNRSPSLSNMLQGKVAGVQINQSASGVGGSTRVILRGMNSLTGNNSPLWVIDGIPIDDSDRSDFSQWGGSDQAGAASDINPDDIESISVLKGPNAAALYGSRAANGVIVINTKKAKQKQPVSVKYNGNYSLDKAYDGYNYQWKYGQGNNGNFDIGSLQSWGPVMTGQLIPNWKNYYYGGYGYNLPDYPMEAQQNRLQDFFRTGFNAATNVAIEGGGENIAGRFSFTDSRNQGILNYNNMVRDYFDANINFQYEKLNVNFKGTYTKQMTSNRVGLGQYGVMQMFVSMPPNIRLSDLRDCFAVDDVPMNWTGPSNEYQNPYIYATPRRKGDDGKDRLTGIITVNYKFTDWLGATAKLGRDYSLIHSYSYGTKSVSGVNTTVWITEFRIDETNMDYMLNFDKRFNKFSILANAGAAFMKRSSFELNANSGTLTIENLYTLAGGSNPTASNEFKEKAINSLLGNVQFGYNSMFYLDVTARNDWSSTLNPKNWSYFYPSFNLSGIISEIFSLPKAIQFLKIRGSYAEVGKDTDPYQLYPNIWTGGFVNGDIKYADLGSTRPFYDLKPERTKSWEFGLEGKFVENRLGFDFTYYKTKTNNQIIPLSISPVSGYTGKFINAGEIGSRGIELSINTTPIQLKHFQWDLNLNWGTNTTECIRLDASTKRKTLGTFNLGSIVVDEGGKYGDIIGYGFLRDDNGNVLVNDNGLPLKTNAPITLGNIQPDWTGSIFNMFRYKDFSLQALIDIKKGGKILSVTDAIATKAGTSLRSIDYRDGGMIVDGIVQSTGQKNTKEINAETYWNSVGSNNATGGFAEPFIYDATYVMLRELSIGYNIPQSIVKKIKVIKNAKFSLVGRDLFYLHKNTPGSTPESASTRADWAQGFDLNSLPPTRNIGINIGLTF